MVGLMRGTAAQERKINKKNNKGFEPCLPTMIRQYQLRPISVIILPYHKFTSGVVCFAIHYLMEQAEAGFKRTTHEVSIPRVGTVKQTVALLHTRH
jgi:hypothetical protein